MEGSWASQNNHAGTSPVLLLFYTSLIPYPQVLQMGADKKSSKTKPTLSCQRPEGVATTIPEKPGNELHGGWRQGLAVGGVVAAHCRLICSPLRPETQAVLGNIRQCVARLKPIRTC